MTTNRYSATRDLTASQRTAGPGALQTFCCGACHKSSPVLGRKYARVLGLRTYVCGPCKTAMHCQKGPKPRPLRELLLDKISRAAGGYQRTDLIGRVSHERRDAAAVEIDKMIAEGLVLELTRPSSRGLPAKRLFTDAQKGQRWQAERDGGAIPTFKPERQGLKPPQPPKPASLPAITPDGLKPVPLPFSPTYSRHEVKPGELVPSVISSAECRPWARQCLGGGA